VTLAVTTILTGALAHAESAVAPPELNPGVTERVERRLIQFELRLTRKGAPVSGIDPADLEIELGGKPLKAFTLDDMCMVASTSPATPPPARPGSFVLYFDEPELTIEGRFRAIEVARRVVDALLARGHNVLIVRNGAALRQETNWTHDAAEVSAALDRIAADPGHRDSLRASADEEHTARLLEQLEGAIHQSELGRQVAIRNAISRNAKLPEDLRSAEEHPEQSDLEANSGQAAVDAGLSRLLGDLEAIVQDELRRIERDVERLRGAVRLLAFRESPKGVVYFADTLRRDPGGVAVRALSNAPGMKPYLNDARWRGVVASSDAHSELQALVRDASTYAVRFYAVEGRGLASASDWVRTSQDTLASLALETGGLSFLNGLAPERIADRVSADQSCWYLVSFDSSGWEEDRAFALGVWPKQPGLRAQARSTLVIPSRATLTATRLVAAHFGDPTLEDRPLSLSIYPVGGTTRNLQVLAQVRLPDADAPAARDTAWDVGFQVASHGRIVAHDANRVTWHGSGQPPVYQSTLSLPAGAYEIVAVAREDASDTVRSGRLSGTWPTTVSGGVTLSVPALAQPQRGGIVLDGQARDSGVIVRGAGNPVDPRAPLAIVTSACVDGGEDARFRVERRIVGETEVSFPSMLLGPDDGRCVQIRDLVAARSLGGGRLTYFVRVLTGEVTAASQEISFDVAEALEPTESLNAPPAR
jgi:hypothetical protein